MDPRRSTEARAPAPESATVPASSRILDRRSVLRAAGTKGAALVVGPSLIAALAAACGGGESEAAGAAETATSTGASASGAVEAKVTELGFDHPFNAVPYVSDLQSWMKKLAGESGDTLLLSADQGKLDLQIANLETWIAQGVPAILCLPLEPATVESLAEKARAKGITWVSYATNIENQDNSVQFQNRLGGELLAKNAAEFVNRVHGGAAKILQLTAPDIGELGRDRDSGIRDTLTELLPDSDIVAEQRGVVTAEGLEVTTATLAAHPDLSVVIAMSDDSGLGAYQAFLDRGHPADDATVWIGGMDGARGALELIKQGTMYRASAALLIEDLANACLYHPLDVANGGSREPAVVPVRVLDHDDPDLLDKYLSQLSV